MSTRTAHVTPHRIRADKPDAYADQTSFAIEGNDLVVRAVGGKLYRYPVATRERRHTDAVAALVVTRTGDGDKAGTGLEERIELVTLDRHTLCAAPLSQWDIEELQAFCRSAGLGFDDVTLKNYAARRRAFREVKGAPVLSLFDRRTTALLLLGLVGLVVLVGAAVVLVALAS